MIMDINKTFPVLIFCRGGSKSIPKKNITNLAGKPLLVHTIDQAKESSHVSDIIVSTDCSQIADVAIKNGAEVLQRPEHLATDTVSEILAWQHAIDSLEHRLAELIIVLPVTSPLRSLEDIERGVERFLEGDCDVLFGICESHRNPYLSMVKQGHGGFLSVVNESELYRRQDAPEVFDICPSLYIANVEYIKNCDRLMDGRVGYIKIPRERAIDIDEPFDLHVAELLLKQPF